MALARDAQAVQAILANAISSKLKDERAVDAKIQELDRVSQVLVVVVVVVVTFSYFAYYSSSAQSTPRSKSSTECRRC